MEFQHCYFELDGRWLVGVDSRHDVEGFHACFFACRAAKKQVRDLMAWRLHNGYPSEPESAVLSDQKCWFGLAFEGCGTRIASAIGIS